MKNIKELLWILPLIPLASIPIVILVMTYVVHLNFIELEKTNDIGFNKVMDSLDNGFNDCMDSFNKLENTIEEGY